MNSKVIKRISLGVVIYLVFAAAVLFFYPDSPKQMDWEDRQQFNKVQIANLTLGVTRADIIQLLGSPDISEAKQVGNNRVQVMFYRTQHEKSDGITTQDECTPLLFKNDELIAWGDGAYQDYNQDW